MLLLLACGASADRVATGAITFPHADGYDAHGAEALSVGADLCLGCHREEAKPCTSCHADYPHVEGWLAGASHGAGILGECQECHGVQGLTAPSCDTCHGSFPHADGWAEGGRHGAWALARGSATASCGSCHGAALEGTASAPSCASCHATYPHATDWAALHGAAEPDACAGCHGEGGTGGLVGVACARCHATYPHAEGFGSGHLVVASSVGEAVCLDCHQAGDGPPGLPAACGATCHGGMP